MHLYLLAYYNCINKTEILSVTVLNMSNKCRSRRTSVQHSRAGLTTVCSRTISDANLKHFSRRCIIRSTTSAARQQLIWQHCTPVSLLPLNHLPKSQLEKSLKPPPGTCNATAMLSARPHACHPPTSHLPASADIGQMLTNEQTNQPTNTMDRNTSWTR